MMQGFSFISRPGINVNSEKVVKEPLIDVVADHIDRGKRLSAVNVDAAGVIMKKSM